MGSVFYMDIILMQLYFVVNGCDSFIIIYIEIIFNIRVIVQFLFWCCYFNFVWGFFWVEGFLFNVWFQLWFVGGQWVGFFKYSFFMFEGVGWYRYVYSIFYLLLGLYWVQIIWEGGIVLEKVVKM